MATTAAAAALVAALWAILAQLYHGAFGLWFEKGWHHLLRYLLAVGRLTYLAKRRGPRFDYLLPESYDDVVSSGAVCTQDEWDRECPRGSESLHKAEDRLFFEGANLGGDRLVLSLSRLKNHVAELWLALWTRDGRCYTLPATFTLDRSRGSGFMAAGLRLQCLAPNRRWRIAFNGLLRKDSGTPTAGRKEGDVHVKFGFIWSAVSHTLEQPAELDCSFLAERFAPMATVDMLESIDRFFAETDAFDQAGMMTGEVTAEGQTREVCLWGFKVRNRGGVPQRRCQEDHFYGYLEEGNFYHLVHVNSYGGRSGVFYGSLYAASSVMRPIDHSVVRTQDIAHTGITRLHMRSGPICLQIQGNCTNMPVVFTSEDTSCEVHATAMNVQCGEEKGSGFALSFRRNGPTTYRIADHLRHKIIQEHEVPKEAPLVSDIREPCSKDPQLTGGKGSSLSVLQSIASDLKTFLVPHGFVVTTASYKLLASCGDFRKLVQQVEKSSMGNDSPTELKETCRSVVTALEKLEMPRDVREEISRCVRKFPADTRFAVRSSALGEDSEDMSAAGQMTTLLGLRTEKKVIEGVLKCWASQFNFTSVNYKRQYGQALATPMAVVVQEMVDAEAAGVMFTCDPLTGNPAMITVTANYGLGESVVSASAEPDTFTLKKTGAVRPFIESAQLGRKSVYTTASDAEGVVMLPVAGDKTQVACISEEQVEALAYIGTQIEKTYTTPQDIEWAICNDNFYMLQCRPVTTFFRESDFEIAHEFDSGLKTDKEVLSKANMSEVLPGATSPLSLTFMRVCFDSYCRVVGSSLCLIYSPDPTQYCPMWLPLQRYNYFMWLSDGQRNAGATLIDKALMFSTLGRDVTEEVEAGVKRSRFADKRKIPLQMYYFLKMMLTYEGELKSAAAKSVQLRLSVDGMTTATQMYRYLGSSLHHLREPAYLLVSAFATSAIYNLVILQILGTANGDLNTEVFCELSKILLGGDVESAEVPRMIQELATLLRQSAEKTRFLNMTIEEASEWLSTAENKCGEMFRAFVGKHGHRTVKEFDVYIKPWSMDPSSLVKSLKAAVHAPELASKERLPPWNVSQLPYRLTLVQRLILKLVIPKARSAVAARETAKSAVVRVIHQLRLVCHQLSRQMVREGRIPSPELLFFFTYEELGLLLRTRAPELVLKAQRRQRLHPKLDQDRYPSLLIGIPKPIERESTRTEGDFEIKGNPMSQGVAEGEVRVAKCFEDAHLIQKGEILVTTATDTGWTPYFPLLAGVVTEIGGPLSHGAVVAREYGLPCVVGIEGITTMLATGDYVKLDGNTGVLRKIAKPADTMESGC